MSDYLKKRATELGMDREGQLAEVQAYLDELYPGMCRAVSLNDGKLIVRASGASLASELRFKIVQIKSKFPQIIKLTIKND